MVIIGVTGAIASGKSAVAHLLAELGAAVIHADRVGHEVLRCADVKAAVYARWGSAVFHAPAAAPQGADPPTAPERDRRGERAGEGGEGGEEGGEEGEIDRRALARRVFAPPPTGPAELAYLEALTHPLIRAEMASQLEQYRAQQWPAVVLDAPVLYKAGWDTLCDKIVYVDATPGVCAARAAERGWSAADLAARQRQQPDLQWQRARADVVLDNSGTRAALAGQVQAFWQSLFPAT